MPRVANTERSLYRSGKSGTKGWRPTCRCGFGRSRRPGFARATGTSVCGRTARAGKSQRQSSLAGEPEPTPVGNFLGKAWNSLSQPDGGL